MSRPLVCRSCGDVVHVDEIPAPFIDPTRFVCGECLEPVTGQLALAEPSEREETRPYDPAIAAVPY